MNRRTSMELTNHAKERVLAGPTVPVRFVRTAGRQVLPAEFTMTFTDIDEGRNTYRVRNAKLLSGDGASCMCYLVSVEMSENEPHRMILKQFYPAAAKAKHVKMDGLCLTIEGFEENEELRKAAAHFADAYAMQRALSDIDELRSFVVTPYRKYFSGSTMYVLYERENGETLDRYFPRSAEELLNIAISLAEAMDALHRADILYMDFKPENILWADMNRAMLFDFDAALDLSRPDGISEIRSTARILAPEWKTEMDFSDKKALFLTPQTDIFSYGSTLIALLTGRWPATEEGDALWKDELNRTLNGEFRGETDESARKEFIRILSRCVAEDLTRRYKSAKEILRDLGKLKKAVLTGKKAVRRTSLARERLLATAYMMEEHPLLAYRRYDENGMYVIDAALAGDGDTALRFFKYILGTQIADTDLIIRWAVPDPYRKMEELFRTMPALSRAAVFYVNGNEVRNEDGMPIGHDTQTVKTPLAYIYLEMWDAALDSAEDLFALFSRQEDCTLLPSWIVFAAEGSGADSGVGAERGGSTDSRAGAERDGSPSERGVTGNKEKALRFLLEAAKRNGFTPERGSGRFAPVFIGYADDDDPPGTRCTGSSFSGTKNGSGGSMTGTAGAGLAIADHMRAALAGEALPEEEENVLEHLLSFVDFASVGSSAGNGAAGRAYGRKMLKRAERIHRFYVKDRNERAPKEEISRTFRADQGYNLESSVCAALSLEAKLVSAGIDPDAPNAAFLFYEKVLSGTPEAERQLREQMALEHRRWTAFMITSGFRAPSEEELFEYAFNGTNDHRELRRKLHPLICASDPASPDLAELPHSEWDDRGKWERFDPLDRASLALHALCAKKASQMDAGHLAGELIADIAKFELKGDWIRAAEWLRQVIGRMLDGEAGADLIFAEEIRIFRAKIEAVDGRRTALRLELMEDIDRIESEMRAVIFRSRYADYKKTDEALVRALPLLVGETVRRVYKPAAPLLWQNVMSSLIIEPEELVLITEHMETETAEKLGEEIRHFLQERRFLATQVIAVSEADAVFASSRGRKAVLDITGMDEADAFLYARKTIFQTMPVTRFRDGALEDFGYGAELAVYSKQKHLTVPETLRLIRPVIKRQQENPAGSLRSGEKSRPKDMGRTGGQELTGAVMTALRPYHRKLYEAYRRVPPLHWKLFAEEMEKQERRQYFEVKRGFCRQHPDEMPPDLPGGLRGFESTPVSGRMLTDTGIRAVLREWKKCGLIDADLTLPTEAKSGSVRFMTHRAETETIFAEMLRRAQSEPYCHTFEVIPLAGGAAVYDSTPIVRFSFAEETCADSSGDTAVKSEAVETVLTSLFQEGVIRPFGREPLLVRDPDTRMCRVTFETDDIAVRKCLLREEDVLTAHVYHTIFQYIPVDDVRCAAEAFGESSADGMSAQKRAGESAPGGAFAPKADIICTKNMKTYFIFCRTQIPDEETLRGIGQYAKANGIEGTAVVICGGDPGQETEEGVSPIENVKVQFAASFDR